MRSESSLLICCGGRGRTQNSISISVSVEVEVEGRAERRAAAFLLCCWLCPLGLYEILFYLEAFVHDSIIRLLPPSTCIARTIGVLLQDHCAIYAPPTAPPFVCHTT